MFHAAQRVLRIGGRAEIVYTIYGDIWAGVSSPVCLLCHGACLGLTPAEIRSAVPVIDGMTAYFDIPALSTTALDNALLAAVGAL
jgi:hypothetical protein